MTTNRFLALLGLCLWAGAAGAEETTAFPVYAGHLLLPEACEAGRTRAWSDRLAAMIGGLQPGAEIGLLGPDGQLRPARLGAPACLAGECRGDYLGLALAPAPGDAVAVLPPAAQAAQTFTAAETPGACDGLPPQGADPAGFGFPPTEPTCTTYSLEDGPTLLLAGQGWMQENGWPIYRHLFRIEGGAWQEIDVATAPLRPRFAWDRPDGGWHLLWTRSEGIGGPPRLTFREQRIGPDGRASWRAGYEAGGQPCD